jgi:integrase/recombinase XerD
MLETFFESETRLRQLRRGVLGQHVDGLATELREAGYTRTSGRALLTLIGKFSLFATSQGVVNATQINEALIARFLQEELPAEGTFKNAANAMDHLLGYLRHHGLIPAAPTPSTEDPFAPLLESYDEHLRTVRGLAPETRHGYLRTARLLMTWQAKRPGRHSVDSLTGPDVLAFVTDFMERHAGARYRGAFCSETRIFLRYLRWADIIDTDLARVVPRMHRRRLDRIPRHLPWEKVRALVDGVDTTYPDGMRDKAILLLLAVLGLRSDEVRALELGHIAWRHGELRLSKTKSRRARVLPLSQEVGAAIADYVLHGRPHIDSPYVFLRHKAPYGPLRTRGAISGIVNKHFRRAGLGDCRSAHLLRHSLATRMVNEGVPIKHIADVLGHASIDTTAIYTKVDTTSLSAVALPFPGSDGS